MDKPRRSDPPQSQIAIRCNQCQRIVAYKIAAGTGRIKVKCPKCGKEMVIDLALRRARKMSFYRVSFSPQ